MILGRHFTAYNAELASRAWTSASLARSLVERLVGLLEAHFPNIGVTFLNGILI